MASEQFCPKCIFEKEFLADMDTNGASLDDLWKDAPLWQKQWCVWSASQAVLFEVTGQLLEEHREERIAPLMQNLPFTDDVFPGKYETCIGETPAPLTRERVRSTCPLNEATEILLHNRLLRRDIDPLMPRAQQVEALLQLESGTEFRVSTSCSTEDNSDDTAGIKDTASAGIKDPIERYPNTALPTAASTTTTPAATTSFAITTASAAAVTSTSITASAATPTTASAAAVLPPPAAAFTPSSAVAAATAIDAAAEGTIDDAFTTAAAAGIAYDPFKKEDAVPAAATDAFDTTSASADLFDASAASGCTGCAAVYDLYFKYTGEEEETHPYLYHNNNKPSSSLYNNNIKPSASLYNNNKPSSSLYNNNKPSSSLYNNNNKPSSSLYNNNKPSSSLYNNNNKPSSSLYNNNKPSSSLYNNNNKPSSSLYNNNKPSSSLYNNNKPSSSLYNNKPSSSLYNNNKPSSSLYNNNWKPSSSLYNKNNDPRLVGFLSNKTESKKRKRNELEYDDFYLKRLRYDNKPSCSPYDNNANPSSFLDNNNKDPRLVSFSAHKLESKKRKRNELQDDGFYLKRLRYD